MKTKKDLQARILKLQGIIDQIAPDGTIRFGTPGSLDLEYDFSQVKATAEELINGDRARTYGSPEVSFGRIADIFNAMGYRHHVQAEGQPLGLTKANKLDAVDAALILLGMKLSRTIGGREQFDNWVDMAGYAGLGGELALPEPTDLDDDLPVSFTRNEKRYD